MIKISYASMVVCISIIWCLIRVIFAIKNNHVNWKSEIQLLLVYICIVVIARFTFFPFSKVTGKIQPLIFESAKAFPFRINWIPLVHLFEYPAMRDILINVIGNTLMFVPVGIVYPIVYKKLDTHTKVIAAGIGFSLAIEILQLPFYDRVSDIDDLLLNSLGYILGYFLYLGVKGMKYRRKREN
ncbi:MAG: VanZ family protein [Lachnospiraceae bacterium]|nr:VanZ family protein [Lachnospiraceae bacterium]